MNRRHILLGCAVALASAPWAVLAQNQKPITIIVGASPGGTTDTLARAMAQSMAVTLKRPVLVENKPGAGGNIAALQVARAAPDGSTLLMSYTSHTINASLFKSLPFDPVADFTPITMVARVPSVLVAKKDAPFDDVKGLVAYAKKNPGKLSFAIGGQGSSLHLATEQFKHATQTDIVNVPYKGTSPALTDLLAGQVDLMFASTVNVLPHYRQGTLKFLGLSNTEPMPQFPGLANISEAVPGYQSQAWFGLFGPAKLPPEVLNTLYQAVTVALADPQYQKRMTSEAATIPTMTPAEFADFVKRDIRYWGDIVKVSGAKVE